MRLVLVKSPEGKERLLRCVSSGNSEKVRAAVLIGEMAQQIAEDWKGAFPMEIAHSLADAVERAHALARSGEVVLFSPGTSSFDMFKSYADRGDQFRALVQALPK